MAAMEVDSAPQKEGNEKVEETHNEKAETEPKVVRGGIEDVRRIVGMIEKAVNTNQTRMISRAMRHNAPVRNLATKELLSTAISEFFPAEHSSASILTTQIDALPSAGDMDVDDGKPSSDTPSPPSAKRTTILPEVEVYLSTLVLTTLLRENMLNEALNATTRLFEYANSFNRRSLDFLRSKVYFYFALIHDKLGSLPSMRPTLLATHRTACLQHDEFGQATLLNILIRNLLENNLVDQAFKLVSKTSFPEKASNNQYCRYLFYTGRIAALQLEYGDAYNRLLQSIRKAPQNTAAGFRRTVQKLMVIVQLLMGEVPERVTFNQPEYRAALAPYLAITKAVRAGDLVQFHAVLDQHKQVFKADAMLTMINRLSHNVIKTGLRRINISYSRISLADICEKLHLESTQSAEFVCAKAIRDGVIDAVLDHENQWLSSNDTANIYATMEPQRAFHKRINFCLDVHNEAVKAMRYPADAYKKKNEEKEPERTEEEIAKEIQDGLEEEEFLI